MSRRAAFAGLIGAVVLAAACREPLSPDTRVRSSGPGPGAPAFARLAAPLAPGSSTIALDQVNGMLGGTGNFFRKGFNTTNPHNGDAIVVTVFWLGSGPNLVTSVFDLMTLPSFPRVGNTYRLVEYVSSGGISMATYVATNVQGFPDAYNNVAQDSILAVEVDLSQAVSGGLVMSSWSGVDAVTSQVVASHSSGSGSSATPTFADPGTVAVGAGALALGMTLSNALVGAEPPPQFPILAVQSNGEFSMVDETNSMVSPSLGSVNPQWYWYFNQPSTWLATVLTLNPPPHLAFTQQPSTTLPLMTMQPAVRVTVLDALGNPATSFNGQVTIAIAHNGGVLVPGALSGTKTVTAVNGVATFADLSIDQPGNGYTLVATSNNVFTSTSVSFNIGAF